MKKTGTVIVVLLSFVSLNARNHYSYFRNACVVKTDSSIVSFVPKPVINVLSLNFGYNFAKSGDISEIRK
jgi:hypothetical protein